MVVVAVVRVETMRRRKRRRELLRYRDSEREVREFSLMRKKLFVG